MSFWPDGFGPHDDVVAALELVEIEAPSGVARFLLGVEGVFHDVNGTKWAGSQLLELSDLDWSRGGEATETVLVLSYFQDPAAPDLIAQLRASGDTAIRDAPVRFYLQPIASVEEFYAPVQPPILAATKTAAGLRYEFQGEVQRRLILTLEGPFALRQQRRGLFYNTSDHAALLGAANPSLEFTPLEDRQEEPLFAP